MGENIITEAVVRSDRHCSFYLQSGPADGVPIVFVHGWPELSISWSRQLAVFGALGFRAIAPDMRGYGRSTVYLRHEDYALERAVSDMLELADRLGIDRAIWVGHDWGTGVVWNIASHHPERCHGVANLCVPYGTLERGLETLVSHIDRSIYPEREYPFGQWDYIQLYYEDFELLTRQWEAKPGNTVKTLFRKGDPSAAGKPAFSAIVRRERGFYGGARAAPDVERDAAVLSEVDLSTYAAALARNGFFGPDSWYMNDAINDAYASTSVNGGRLEMPVLFLHGKYDHICETVESTLAQPMRGLCADLTERVVPSGHWMPLERPSAVNSHLLRWIATTLSGVWE
jgi:pimeloyl-ACP methyl ester carboxylesterase